MALNLGEVTFRIGADATALEKAGKSTAKFKKVVDTTSKSLDANRKKTSALSDKMTDLSKSVQVALGPLSGVAARLTAITALANRNTAAIAGVIGGVIGFGVAAGKSVKAGVTLEKQLFQIEGRLKATGGAVGFTTDQLDKMARQLGDKTLTTAEEARKAILVLMTATSLQGEQFREVLGITQDLASLGFGNLGRQAQRLARVITDPLQNIETLRRVNIKFDDSEKRLLKTLKNTGKEFELISLIIKKFGLIQGVAENETEGLAGAMDSLSEIITNFLADASRNSGALQGLAKEIRAISAAFTQQAEATGALQKFGDTVRVIFVGGAKALTLFLENFEELMIIMAGFVAARVVLGLTAGIIGLARAFTVAGASAKAFALINKLKLFTSLKAFLAVIGLAAAAILLYRSNTKAVGEVVEDVTKLVTSFGNKLGKAFEPKPLAELTEELRKTKIEFALVSGAIPLVTEKMNRFGFVFNAVANSATFLDERVFRLADKFGLLGTALQITRVRGEDFILKFVGPAGVQLEKLNKTFAKMRTLKEFTELVKATRTPLEVFADQLNELADLRERAFIFFAKDSERLALALRAVARSAREAKKEFEDATGAGQILKEVAVDFTTTIASGLEDAISEGKALSEVFQSLENDLIKLILRATFFKPLEEGLSAAFEGRATSFGGDLAENARKFLVTIGFGEDATEDTNPAQQALDKQTAKFNENLFKLLTSTDQVQKVLGEDMIASMGKNITETQLQSLASLSASTGLKEVATAAFGAAAALQAITASVGGVGSKFDVRAIESRDAFEPLADFDSAIGKATDSLSFSSLQDLPGGGFGGPDDEGLEFIGKSKELLDSMDALTREFEQELIGATAKQAQEAILQAATVQTSTTSITLLGTSATSAALALQQVAASSGVGGIGGIGDIFGGFSSGIGQIGSTGLDFAGFGGTGGIGFVGPFAKGGDFTGGQNLLVGEEGPEIVSFAKGGRVIANDEIQGVGGGVQIVFNISTPDANSFRQSQGQIMSDALRFVQSGQRNT